MNRQRSSCAAVALLLLLAPVGSRAWAPIRVADGQDLQKAIDTARPGDVILLAAGARFRGNYVLPASGESDLFITIRTDAPDLPDAGVRTDPKYSGTLAVLQSPSSSPALRTAPRAHHWRLENLEFGPNLHGEGNIIELGQTPPEQRSLTEVPHSLVLDRVYIHGDPQIGQKRGIGLNSASTEIVNSYITDMKAIGVDTQAIGGWNGPGPYLIENNYLAAAGENIMFGGADPAIEGLVPTDITIRRNYITKSVAWRDPILKPPTDVRASATSGGSLAAGTYLYVVAAERAVAGSTATSIATSSPPVDVASSGSVALEWEPVHDVAAYVVYRVKGAAPAAFWRVTAPRFTDTGMAGEAGSPPKRASVWQVKNLLQLKSAKKVLIDSNRLENNWSDAQVGYAVQITPRNQDGHAPWCRIEDVRFVNNVVRHSGSGINISGTDDEKPSERTRGVVIANNVFTDLNGATWGGDGDFVQLGNGPEDVTIESNTVEHSGRIASIYGSTRGREIPRFVFRNNIVRHNRYGVIGVDASPGSGTLAKYAPGSVFEGNVIAGGERSQYPRDNHVIGANDFEALFASAERGDYRLKEGSAFTGAGANSAVLQQALIASTSAPDAKARRH